MDDTLPPPSNAAIVPRADNLSTDRAQADATLPPVMASVLLAGLPADEQRGPRYTFTRLHAEGGLGRVWVAHDDTLNRDVALKELKPQLAQHVESSRRFLKEAQVTGQLEHPNIVPVYELGCRPEDQQPFYTMRFVRGMTLRDACTRFHADRLAARADPLALPKLLNAFGNVCQALLYAHARGVVHRDLKPDNIILGSFGEVLVLDWGLAKLQGESEDLSAPVAITAGADSGATAAGHVMGTPAYMAPEQAAGRGEQIDARTDIYGLGAILFEILTGQPPHRGATLGAVLESIRVGPTPRARDVDGWVPHALDAICARAMAYSPAARYGSAAELADDVQRWLADQPVSVYRERLLARLGRLLRRHRTWAMAGAASLVLITLVSIVATVLVNDQRQVAEQARFETLAALGREAKQRRVADETRNVAIDSLNTLVFDVQQRMEGVPALQDLQRDLLQTALRGSQQVGRQLNASDVEADELSAHAQVKIADVLVSLGASQDAENLYRSALTTFTQLAAKSPKSGDLARYFAAQQPVALICDRLGNLSLEAGELAASRRYYDHAWEMRNEWVTALPDDRQAQSELSVSFNKLGATDLQAGKIEDARRRFEQGLEITEKLAQHDRLTRSGEVEAAIERQLSVSYDRLGGIALRQGELAAARKFYAQALEIQQRHAQRAPSHTQAQRDLSVSLNQLGAIAIQQSDIAAARRHYDQALAITAKLAKGDPQNITAQRDLSIINDSLGDLCWQQGDLVEGRSFYERALQLAQQVAEADPGNARAQRDLVVSQNKLGALLMQQGDLAAARRYYEAGRVVCERQASADPQDAQAQRDLSISYNRLGEVDQFSGDLPAARRWFEKALALREPLAQSAPADAQAQRGLWVSYSKLGEVCSQQGELDAARKHCEQALAICKRLATTDANNALVQRELALSHADLGAIYEKQAHFPEAIREYRAAIDVLSALVAAGKFAAPAQAEIVRLRKCIEACQEK